MYLTPTIGCDANASQFSAWTSAFYGDALGPAVAEAYQPQFVTKPLPVCQHSGNGTYYMSAMRSAGDYAITCKVRQTAKVLAKRRHRTFEYFFTATPRFSLNYDNIPTLGAFHGAEVPFAFGDTFELTTDAERSLSQKMGCFWRNFAWTGDPNVGPGGRCNTTTGWPAFGTSAETEKTLVLGLNNTANTSAITVATNLKSAQCEAFQPSSQP